MQPEPKDQPPGLPAADAPVTGALLPPPGGAPPLLQPAPARNAAPLRRILAGLLGVCLALFLADAVLSLAVGTLALLLGVHLLSTISGLVALLALLVALLVYGLMGLTPMIPKRLFLPIVFFNPAAVLVFIPLVIYLRGWTEQVGWVISFCQVALGLLILRRVQGGFRLRWPLVPESRLGPRSFSWLNLSGFVLVNLLVLMPATIVYLGVSAALAVHHSTGGFLELRPGGFTVQVRRYVRNDGKTVLLVPMAHIGEAEFYRKLSRSFPTNSVVLMEGVTDDKNLLTNQISYKRMASTLGLSEQQSEFKPVEVEMVRADVDVAQFTTNTIGLLNLVMLVHARGVNAETVSALLGFSAPPHMEEQLIDDLVTKRNRRVLREIHDRLAGPKPIIVPWGVAHMPGIAAGITAAGFHLAEAQDHTVIRFHFPGAPQPPRAPSHVPRHPGAPTVRLRRYDGVSPMLIRSTWETHRRIAVPTPLPLQALRARVD